MIQRYEYYNANIEPRSDGRIVFYADAAKWVQEEIAKKDEEEEQTRLFLLLNHGHSAYYVDDGEMQCGKCIPNWDYKRLPLKTLISQMLGLKDEEIAKKDNEIARACVIIAEGLKVVEELEGQIAALKSLVNGASNIVEIWAAESPAQKEWRDNWLAKAREVLK